MSDKNCMTLASILMLQVETMLSYGFESSDWDMYSHAFDMKVYWELLSNLSIPLIGVENHFLWEVIQKSENSKIISNSYNLIQLESTSSARPVPFLI